MEAADVGRRLPEGLPEVLVHGLPGGLQLRFGHFKGGEIRAVEPAGVFPQGFVAPGADGLQHGVHRRVHVRLRLGAPVKEGQVLQAVRLVNGDHDSVTSVSFFSSVSIWRCLNW